MSSATQINSVPLWQKLLLTAQEASTYSGIGVKTLREQMNKPDCPFVFHVGNKTLVKRAEFERYIGKHQKF